MIEMTEEEIQKLIKTKQSICNSRKRYAEKNPEKIKEWARNHYNKVKNEPEFKQKQLERAKLYYAKKQQKRRSEIENEKLNLVSNQL